MNILYRKKIISVINNHIDLENFIRQKNFYDYFMKIPEEFVFLVNEQISLTPNLNYKKFKQWYRDIVKYPMSVYNPNFLIAMGWDIHTVNDFIREKQRRNANIISEKKKLNPEKYYDKTVKRVEYWLKKGYTEDEAKKIISESQKTFSKKICITKYGKEKGLEIFRDRQLRWVKSMMNNPNLTEIRKKQNAYINKTYDEMINRTSFLEETKNIIQLGIETDDVDQFTDFVLSLIDVKCLSDVAPYINSKIIQKRYSTSREKMKDLFYSKVTGTVKNGYYGCPVYHNGVRFKSVKEYKLSLLFEMNDVEFIYEKKYPNNKYISDFYLPEYDTYVEYYGILDGKNHNLLDDRQLKYLIKMEEKNLHCLNENLNLIYDTDFNKLYEKLQTLITNENNN